MPVNLLLKRAFLHSTFLFSPNTIIRKKTPKRKHGQAENGVHTTMRVWHVVPYPNGKGGMCYNDPETGEQRPVLDGTFLNVTPDSESLQSRVAGAAQSDQQASELEKALKLASPTHPVRLSESQAQAWLDWIGARQQKTTRP